MSDPEQPPQGENVPGGGTTVAVQGGGNRQMVGGRYELCEEIGKGGMGIVYLALDCKLNRHVAMKRLVCHTQNAQVVEKRFLREAQTIASLGHANIVNVYDIGKDEIGLFIIMEYVGGPVLESRASSMRPPAPMTVEQYVKTQGTFSADDCRQLLSRLSLALDYAHKQGVIHRDIKPANILLDGQFEPKLVDFGLAMPMDKPESMELTQQGALLGTPDYAAPEQWTDAATADGRSDLYSLAASAWFMLKGESPRYFREKSLPDELREVLCRALEKDRDKRYATAREFHEALKDSVAPVSSVANSEYDDRTIATAAGSVWVCKSCGTQNMTADDYCRGCGAQGSRECQVCSAKVQAGSRFCSKCGADVDSAELTAEVISQARSQAAENEYESALVTLRELPGEVTGEPGEEVKKWRQTSLHRRNLMTDLETAMRSCNYARAAELFLEARGLMPRECLSDSADYAVLDRFRSDEYELKEGLRQEIDKARAELNLARFDLFIGWYAKIDPSAEGVALARELSETKVTVDNAVAQAGLAAGLNCVSRALGLLQAVPAWRGGPLGDRRERLTRNLADLMTERERELDEIEELMSQEEYDEALRALLGLSRFRIGKSTREVEPDAVDAEAARRLNEADKKLLQLLPDQVGSWIANDRWDQLRRVRELAADSPSSSWKRFGEEVQRSMKREVSQRFERAVQAEHGGRFAQAEKAWESFGHLPTKMLSERMRRTAAEFATRSARYYAKRGRGRARRLVVILLLLWGYPLAKAVGSLVIAFAGDQLSREMIVSLWPQPLQFLLFMVVATFVFLGKEASDRPFRYLKSVNVRTLFLCLAAIWSPASWMIADFARQWLPPSMPPELPYFVPVLLWFLCDLLSGNRFRPPAGMALTCSWLVSAFIVAIGIQPGSHLNWLFASTGQAAVFLLIHLLHKLLIPPEVEAEPEAAGG